MSRPRRGTLFIAMFLVVIAASLTATVQNIMCRLPDPETADREGLFRWVVTRDLAEETPLLRERLMNRLANEFDQGLSTEGITEQLDDAQFSQLRQNVDLLLGEWFEKQADRYFALQESQRNSLLDAQIERIGRWGSVGALVESSQPKTTDQEKKATEEPPSQLDQLMRWADMAKRWIARAKPNEQEQLRQFVAAIQQRVLSRMLWPTASI